MKRFMVVGLGRNGLPVAAALQRLGARVAVWDDQEAARDAAPYPLHDPAHGLAGFDALVLSPGIPHLRPAPHFAAVAARAANLPIWSDAELLYQATRAAGRRTRFAGITGTNGKSTTTALLHHILAAAGIDSAAGGNLGTAALALPPLPDDGVYVLEMSSYMLERLATLRFDVACLLNLSPDHIDRHGDMAGYTEAKRHVFDRMDATGTAVIGPDIDAPHGPQVERIGPAQLRGIDLAAATALPGRHNAENAAAAAAMARALGVPEDAIAEGILTFPGLPHRQEVVAVVGGTAWVNDSKATNADAAACALACYDRIAWIAGGQAKHGGIAPLAPFFPRIVHALLIGQDAPALAATLGQAGVPHTVVGTLEAAVDAARAVPADCVLLSPACASWDQFTGFAQRGDRFRALVRSHVLGEAA